MFEDDETNLKAYLSNDPFNVELDRSLTEQEKLATKEMLCIGKRVTGHAVPDFSRVIRKGVLNIIDEIEGYKKMQMDREKILFSDACEISLNALIDYAKRYSALVLEMAQNEKDPKRKSELEKISKICIKVPAYPAEDFHEAIQSFWFVYAAMNLEQSPNPYAFSVGRFDSFMYSYLDKDLKSERINIEGALELLGCLWLKFMVGRHCWATSQNILLAGQDEDGKNASNMLTELCIEITKILKIPQPSVAFRYFEGISNDIFRKALDLVKVGIGMPSFHNDSSVIDIMISEGIVLKDARNYAIAGCQEPVVQGKENGRTTGGKFNLVKCLEVSMNSGKSILTGAQLGLLSKLPEEISSYEEFYEVFLRQLDYSISLMASAHNKSDYLLSKYKPVPFLSCLMDDCFKKAKDFRADGAKYNSSGVLVHGLGTTADSLAVIKKAIFEEKLMSFAELVSILKQNFDGNLATRLRFLNKYPKFGNSDEYVDEIAAKLMSDFTDILGKYRNHFGGRLRAGFNTPSTHVHYGAKTAATPDGRLAHEPFSYGTGPAQGRSLEGPTSIIYSMTKLPQYKATLGTDLSISFNPANLNSTENLDKLGALIKAYFAGGGHHIMFNVIKPEVLREAQRNPEKYSDLVVRIHGYSAYFNSLTKEIQDDLIERIESSL